MSTPAGPPWIDLLSQRHVRWRDGDVVVSAPARCGTTWTMNIVHQLRSGGDPDFADLCVEVPWLELVEHPGQLGEDRLARWEAMPSSLRRVFKTHSPPPLLPYVEPEPGSPQVKYVVVLRNPEDMMASLQPFLAQHSRAFFELWGVPGGAFERDDFATFYTEVIEAQQFDAMPFGFLASWWPLRARANVMLLHFSELYRDPEATIRKLAAFLGFAPSAAQWPKILEYCSVEWMRAHSRKFELAEVAAIPILDSGAMIRKARVGAAHEDGMTPALAARLRSRGAAILDSAALEWHYRGGPLE